MSIKIRIQASPSLLLTRANWAEFHSKLDKIFKNDPIGLKAPNFPPNPKSLNEFTFLATKPQLKALEPLTLTINGKIINFLTLEPKAASGGSKPQSNHQRARGTGRGPKEPIIDDYKLYVSNVPEELDDRRFTEIFERFGPVRNAYVCSSKRKGRFLYGFVSYFHKSSVKRALENKYVEFKWFKMSLKKASCRPETVKKQGRKSGGGGKRSNFKPRFKGVVKKEGRVEEPGERNRLIRDPVNTHNYRGYVPKRPFFSLAQIIKSGPFHKIMIKNIEENHQQPANLKFTRQRQVQSKRGHSIAKFEIIQKNFNFEKKLKF